MQEGKSPAKPLQKEKGALETSTDILKDFRERNRRARELAGSDEAFLDMHTKQIEQNAAAVQKPVRPQSAIPGRLSAYTMSSFNEITAFTCTSCPAIMPVSATYTSNSPANSEFSF